MPGGACAGGVGTALLTVSLLALIAAAALPAAAIARLRDTAKLRIPAGETGADVLAPTAVAAALPGEVILGATMRALLIARFCKVGPEIDIGRFTPGRRPTPAEAEPPAFAPAHKFCFSHWLMYSCRLLTAVAPFTGEVKFCMTNLRLDGVSGASSSFPFVGSIRNFVTNDAICLMSTMAAAAPDLGLDAAALGRETPRAAACAAAEGSAPFLPFPLAFDPFAGLGSSPDEEPQDCSPALPSCEEPQD
mmetsp:Transcript_120317/g.221289  ORF Transcript_120317/g.221289 Transcript_120317/m.221289 type:complete len:248 (-) Transcript_120317:949-1692(-)